MQLFSRKAVMSCYSHFHFLSVQFLPEFCNTVTFIMTKPFEPHTNQKASSRSSAAYFLFKPHTNQTSIRSSDSVDTLTSIINFSSIKSLSP
jgi:hypothetical protein